MHKAARRGRWTWMVAGALAVTSPALAQPAGPPPCATRQDAAVAATEAAHRAEVQVKLAWLADPVTFRHLLAVHPRGASLEVEGYVPNEDVRRRALELARAEAGMPVVDALQVQPRMVARSVKPLPVAAMQQSAAVILQEAFGALAGDYCVLVRDDGQLTVLGWIGSEEEKLAVSQRLCRLEGCTSINNQLRVPARPTAVPAVTLAPPIRQEPRPLPSSFLRAATASISPPVPELLLLPVRPVIKASTVSAPPPATSKPPPAPRVSAPPNEPIELPRIVCGPQAGTAPRLPGPGTALATTTGQDPPATTAGVRVPEIICPPVRVAEIKGGAAWPMRCTLELSGPTRAPVRWYEPAGLPETIPSAPASFSTEAPCTSVPAQTAKASTATASAPRPQPAATPAVAVLRKPEPTPALPGDPYVTTGVVTFLNEAEAGGGSRCIGVCSESPGNSSRY